MAASDSRIGATPGQSMSEDDSTEETTEEVVEEEEIEPTIEEKLAEAIARAEKAEAEITYKEADIPSFIYLIYSIFICNF